MKRFSFLLTIFVVLTAYLEVNLSVADDLSRPKVFFKDNYAKDPLAKDRNLESRKPIQKQQIQVDKEEKGVEKGFKPEQQGKEDEVVKESIVGDTFTIKSIGAIINSVDETHYTTCLKQLVSVLVRYNLSAGQVIAMGSLNNMLAMTRENEAIAFRGGVVSFETEVPEQYQISQSPTWIVTTETGEVVIEGVKDLGKMLNAKGKLILTGR